MPLFNISKAPPLPQLRMTSQILPVWLRVCVSFCFPPGLISHPSVHACSHSVWPNSILPQGASHKWPPTLNCSPHSPPLTLPTDDFLLILLAWINVFSEKDIFCPLLRVNFFLHILNTIHNCIFTHNYLSNCKHHEAMSALLTILPRVPGT